VSATAMKALIPSRSIILGGLSWCQFGLVSFQIIINSIRNMNLSYVSKNPNMRKLKIKRELAGFQFSKRALDD